MNVICSKVFYDIELKYKELKEFILTVKQGATKDKNSRVALIAIWLYTFRFLFKDKAFAHEKEARLIFHLAESVPSEDYMGHGFAIKYRPKNGYIIPYIEIEVPITCFKSITVGPLIAQLEAKQSLQKFLKSRGYNNVEINCSNVPVRY